MSMTNWHGESNAVTGKDHEYFFELCALALAGELSDNEWTALNCHLVDCDQCKKRVHEYRKIDRMGIASLIDLDSPDLGLADEQYWSAEEAKRELFSRLRGERTGAENDNCARKGVSSIAQWVHDWARNPETLGMRYAWGTMLAVAVALGAYLGGIQRGQQRIKEAVGAEVAATKDADLVREQLKRQANRQRTLEEQVVARSAELRRASDDVTRQTAETERAKALQSRADEEVQRASAMLAQQEAQQNALAAERDSLSRKLQDSEGTLLRARQELEASRGDHSVELTRTAGLEQEVKELRARLEESDATIQQQRNYLAADRDIRELIGARDLYMADVYDVDQNGQTQKPFGHIFYTRNKSLIFYAYDLDQQAALRKPNIFQAWGRRGLMDKSPLNMGVFYLDSENKKRWVLKFDNPDELAQIDAVFVTVEPHTGSPTPSGRQLLFASLRNEPNHR